MNQAMCAGVQYHSEIVFCSVRGFIVYFAGWGDEGGNWMHVNFETSNNLCHFISCSFFVGCKLAEEYNLCRRANSKVQVQSTVATLLRN
ncbi:hypothetical protein KC19_2G113900 [Ceratodon purpureus]|uniref:Uncharacterized protein n=1 Tax=Ceratodon purpureus TaxID=3225 RepID=A0A8T0IUD0_CERPU|nr:hypothetical protein KC19_2G113900 [Ceratodon purpureus]